MLFKPTDSHSNANGGVKRLWVNMREQCASDRRWWNDEMHLGFSRNCRKNNPLASSGIWSSSQQAIKLSKFLKSLKNFKLYELADCLQEKLEIGLLLKSFRFKNIHSMDSIEIFWKDLSNLKMKVKKLWEVDVPVRSKREKGDAQEFWVWALVVKPDLVLSLYSV